MFEPIHDVAHEVAFRDLSYEPVTIAFQALSLVEKVEPVQVLASHYVWGTN